MLWVLMANLRILCTYMAVYAYFVHNQGFYIQVRSGPLWSQALIDPTTKISFNP